MTGTEFVDLLVRLRALAQHEHSDVSVADEAADLIDDLWTHDVALLRLLADIRQAAGDPEGKLMQEELVAQIAKMREHYKVWLEQALGKGGKP